MALVGLVAVVCVAYLTFDPAGPAPPKAASGTVGAEVGDAATVRGERAATGPRMAPGAAWWPVDLGVVEPGAVPPGPQAATGAVLVALADDLGAWREGDTIAMPVPQTGETFQGVIDRVETLIGNSRSYTARVADDPPRSFVVTVAPQSTFAWVPTNSGAFELTGNARFAWIAPATGLGERFANGQPDVILPEEGP